MNLPSTPIPRIHFRRPSVFNNRTVESQGIEDCVVEADGYRKGQGNQADDQLVAGEPKRDMLRLVTKRTHTISAITMARSATNALVNVSERMAAPWAPVSPYLHLLAF